MAERYKKNKVVRAWVDRHVNDHYVHLAKQDGYRSRAAYKLTQIDTEDKLLLQSKIIIDLGCAPGSWSQVAVKKIVTGGHVIGLDLLAMEPINGVTFIQGDFTKNEILKQLIEALDGEMADVVISDMAPNLSGIKSLDQTRSAYLVELVLDFSRMHLKTGGNCLIKVFHGSEFDALLNMARLIFEHVIVRKPDASRNESSETYLLCKNKRNLPVV